MKHPLSSISRPIFAIIKDLHLAFELFVLFFGLNNESFIVVFVID